MSSLSQFDEVEVLSLFKVVVVCGFFDGEGWKTKEERGEISRGNIEDHLVMKDGDKGEGDIARLMIEGIFQRLCGR